MLRPFLRIARPLCVAALCAAALPLSAAEYGKEDSCKYQGQVIAAVQQARLDRVAQDAAEEAILAADPQWPEAFSAALPQLVKHVYTMKRRELKRVDLGETLEAQCLESWDQIQALQKSLTDG